MRTAALFTLTLFAAGCGNRPDQKPLTQFLHAIEQPLKTDYEDKIRVFPQEEWTTRRFALLFRDNVTVIDDFLATSPNLSDRGRSLIVSLRVTCVGEAELFETMIAEKRFKMTDVETGIFSRLRAEFQEKLLVIGRRIDGKD